MKILLDTQAFLWLALDSPMLSITAKKYFLNTQHDFLLSLASTWEMAIKHSLGKLIVKQPLEKFILNQLQENSIQQLDISFRHIMQIKTLDFHHRDPFDRLLIAQAITEDLPILSSDHAFDHYGVKRLW